MLLHHRKGRRRIELDAIRRKDGEPRANDQRNQTPNCKYAKGGKAFRKRGRDRFRTGRKTPKGHKAKL